MTTALLDSSSTSSSPPKSPPLQTEANSMPVSEVTNDESQIEQVDDEQPLLDNYGRVRQPGPGHWDSNGEYVRKHGTDYVYIDNGSFLVPFRWLDLANLPPVSEPVTNPMMKWILVSKTVLTTMARKLSDLLIIWQRPLYWTPLMRGGTGSEDGADDSTQEITGVAYQVKTTINGAAEEKLVE